MKKILIVSSLVLLQTLSSSAQHAVKGKAHKTPAQKPAKAVTINPSRGIVDNKYSYYNTERGGYIFYDNGRESFVPSLPIVPENNFNIRTSIPLGRKLDLDLYPQQHYPNSKLVHPDQNTH